MLGKTVFPDHELERDKNIVGLTQNLYPHPQPLSLWERGEKPERGLLRPF